jgi:hypothetical protein
MNKKPPMPVWMEFALGIFLFLCAAVIYTYAVHYADPQNNDTGEIWG